MIYTSTLNVIMDGAVLVVWALSIMYLYSEKSRARFLAIVQKKFECPNENSCPDRTPDF